MQQEKARIAKLMSRIGLCSRREAEAHLQKGAFTFKGERIDNPAFKLSPDELKFVRFNGKNLPRLRETSIYKLHKPRGYITSAKDEKGRKTIFELLPRKFQHLITIGRLDYNTEGLLLLTNDGELARKMELPSSAYERCYKVRAFGVVDKLKLKEVESGVTIAGVKYLPVKIQEVKKSAEGRNQWFEVVIKEGKNREVRKLFEFMGLKVNRLVRTAFGPYKLAELRVGEIVEVELEGGG